MSSRNGSRPLRRGAVLAPGYRVVEHISRGRPLDVYDAWSEARRTRCVAKRLRPDCADDASARRRLLAEGRLLRRLSHPHLVRAYEVIARPEPTVILEPLPGDTLDHLVHEGSGRLPAAAVAGLGRQLASAVAYLHGEGVLHLELKPSNIDVAIHGSCQRPRPASSWSAASGPHDPGAYGCTGGGASSSGCITRQVSSTRSWRVKRRLLPTRAARSSTS